MSRILLYSVHVEYNLLSTLEVTNWIRMNSGHAGTPMIQAEASCLTMYVAKAAKEWGLYRVPRIHPIGLVLLKVLQAARIAEKV